MTTKLLSREPDGLTISDVAFRQCISTQLELLTKVHFPVGKNSGLNLSEPLSRHQLTEELQNFLKENGYSVVSEWMDYIKTAKNIRIDCGPTRWWLYGDKGDVISLHAHWNVHAGGISLFLETFPLGGGGNHTDATLLAKQLGNYGYAMSLNHNPLVLALMEVGGCKDFSWYDLGIEPSRSIETHFDFFIQSLNRLPNAASTILAIASGENTPFCPNPIMWRSSNRGTFSIPSNHRVPESASAILHTRWLEQYKAYGRSAFPTWPTWHA